MLRDGLSVEAAAHMFGANAIRLQQDQEAIGGKKKSQCPNEKFRAITKNVGRATGPNRDCARVRQAKGQVGTGKTLMALGGSSEWRTSGLSARRCETGNDDDEWFSLSSLSERATEMGKEGER